MGKLLLKNVRLEEAFEREGEHIIATQTAIYDVLIEDGYVKQLETNIVAEDGMEVIDAQKQLLLPSFREMHIHIDKTYFGGEWQAPRPITKGILTRIEEEQLLLPKQLPTAAYRAEEMVKWLIAQGHTHIRSHCNVDPQIGTKHIEITKQVLEKYKDQITYDIVAFPQHGLLRSNVEGLIREAMTMGATLVGGVDPSIVDRHIEKSLETTMGIAKDYNAGIDIHIHTPNTLGEFEFYKLIDLTKQAKKEGQVTISHAMALADLTQPQLGELVQAMAAVQMDVTSTVPVAINRSTIPIPYLYDNGVKVSLGHDSLTDHWSPYGTGNTIMKLNVMAERFRFMDEYSLSRSWKYASGGIIPLNDAGERIWPKVGDAANMLLVDGVSSAHVVARRCPISTVISQGTIIHQQDVGELKGELR
ncbi:amidohydrolase family protein [Lysinibacillus piscis]|uniref:Deaminase n=1 Tax=Lysinibacillus piscis TaxID=2518931 RepID=A0ABQ5NJG7_9BACI|nr:amidohydrolase family protein [Lysinibacillus sp. KH24]GLC88174.1 deaminase [Lysinibacillus sp. KH24]